MSPAAARLGRIGIWSGPLRRAAEGEAVTAGVELERLGFQALWLPGGGEGLFDRVRAILSATRQVVVATGIVSIWNHAPASIAAETRATLEAYPDRFLLGLGISHPERVEADEPGRYRSPMKALAQYLDVLDLQPHRVAASERILAALGPQALALARDRSAGTHPYFVPVTHTSRAREIIGPGKLLAPELAVVLDTNPIRARRIARGHINHYLGLRNYVRNLLREGFTQADLEGGGSDRLVDSLVAWGGIEQIRARANEHIQAGADHVCLQVIVESGQDSNRSFPVEAWRELAALL